MIFSTKNWSQFSFGHISFLHTYFAFLFLGSVMAFLNKVGNVLKQTVSKHAGLQFPAPNASIFQAMRSMCMSTSSKLFVGGAIVVFLYDVFFLFFSWVYNCLYIIAGLSYSTDEMSLKEAFSQYGEVVEGTVFIVNLIYLFGYSFYSVLLYWIFCCETTK